MEEAHHVIYAAKTHQERIRINEETLTNNNNKFKNADRR